MPVAAERPSEQGEKPDQYDSTRGDKRLIISSLQEENKRLRMLPTHWVHCLACTFGHVEPTGEIMIVEKRYCQVVRCPRCEMEYMMVEVR